MKEGIGVQMSLNFSFITHCDWLVLWEEPTGRRHVREQILTRENLAEGPDSESPSVFGWCMNDSRRSRGSMMVWNEHIALNQINYFKFLSSSFTRCGTTG